MAKRLDSIQVTSPKSFNHDLSHQHVTTIDWFRLQPVAIVDMVQKDSFNVDLSSIIEASPLATKVYGSASIDFHAFFIPFRILWDEWTNYRYGNTRDNSNNFVIPNFTLKRLNQQIGGAKLSFNNGEYTHIPEDNELYNCESRKVLGSLGYPTFSIVNDASAISSGATDNGEQPLSALPARALLRVWWDWFRDSVNIEESSKSAYLKTSGGIISDDELRLLCQAHYRCWAKDYITTLLPSPQMGEASVATVSNSLGDVVGTNPGGTVFPMFLSRTNQTLVDGSQSESGYFTSVQQKISAMAMRGAIALQRFLEKLNVTGTRPIERIQSLFGGNIDSVRLDMSEWIGSYRQRINISGLTNTGSSSSLSSSETDNVFGIDTNGSDFGTQRGRAYSEGNSPRFSYTAKEDGFFMIVASVLPEYINPSGVNRLFFRGLATPDSDRNDFYTPEFDGIGYQETLMNEVCQPEYTFSTRGLWGVEYDPYKVVGYQPKYEDYRYIQDRISGDFQESTSSTALRNMVFVRNFVDGYQSGTFPSANQLTTAQLVDKQNFDNHFQVTDSTKDHFVLNLYIKLNATRPITKTELPTALADMANSDLISVANGGVRL